MERPFCKNSPNVVFLAMDIDFVRDHMGKEAGGRRGFVGFSEDQYPFVGAESGVPFGGSRISSSQLGWLGGVDCRRVRGRFFSSFNFFPSWVEVLVIGATRRFWRDNRIRGRRIRSGIRDGSIRDDRRNRGRRDGRFVEGSG